MTVFTLAEHKTHVHAVMLYMYICMRGHIHIARRRPRPIIGRLASQLSAASRPAAVCCYRINLSSTEREVMQVEHRCNAGTAKFKVSWRPLGPVVLESQKSFRRHGGLAETFWNTEILDNIY